ncbi:MAG: translation initiation factor IF-3 [Sedimentisphaeraceae bacterium JB056]
MSKQKALRVNGRIRSRDVRLIDQDNNQVGVVRLVQAIEMANEVGMDVVEVSPNTEPPVCRIMDYGKWLYDQKRKAKLSKKKQHVVTTKEIRLRPEIGENDLNVKVNHARKFLEKGDKVQFTIRFRGREMMHASHGRELMDGIYETLEDISKVDRTPLMQGRRMIMILVPR